MRKERKPVPTAVLGLAFSVFLGGLGGGVAFPILPLLGIQLGLSPGFLGLILSANRITRLMFNQPAGSLANRWSYRAPVVLGLLIESLATFTYVLALRFQLPGPLLLLGRALWGVGSAFLVVGAMTAALNLSGRDNRGSVAAWVRTALNLGFPAGLSMGGLVAGTIGDAAAFWTATLSSLFGAAIVWLALPPSKKKELRPTAEAGHRAQAWWLQIWDGLYQFFHDPVQRKIGIMNALFFFSLQGVLFATLVLLIDERDLNLFGWNPRTSSGMFMAFMALASAVVTIFIGKQLDRSTYRLTIVIPMLYITATGFSLLALSHETPTFIVAVVMLGVGMGGISVPLLALLGDVTPHGKRGSAIGLYQLCGDLGGSFGPMVGLYALTRFGSLSTYLCMSVLMLLAVLPVIQLRRIETRRLRMQPINEEG